MSDDEKFKELDSQFGKVAGDTAYLTAPSDEFLKRADAVALSMNVSRDELFRQILEPEIDKLWDDLQAQDEPPVDPVTGWLLAELELIERAGVPAMMKPENNEEALRILADLSFCLCHANRGGAIGRKARSMRSQIIRKYSAAEAPEPSS